MATQQIRSEYLLAARETTPYTAIAQPTIYLPMRSLLEPKGDDYTPSEATGTYEKSARSVRTKEWSELGGQDIGMDADLMPYIMEGICGTSGVTVSTPTGATTSRLWVGVPSALPDLRTFTVWTGSPTVQIEKAAGATISSFKLTADGSGNNGSMMNFGMMAAALAAATSVTIPSRTLGSLIIPKYMQAWVDNLTQGGTIGTTSILGAIYSAEHTLDMDRDPLYLPGGPTAGLGFSEITRGDHQMNSTIKVLKNTTGLNMYTQWKANDLIALRVRHNGPKIETVTGTDFYKYVEVDTFGRWGDFGWDDYASGRGIQVKCGGLLNPATNSSFVIRAQNTLSAML